jgi:hypothetical protein
MFNQEINDQIRKNIDRLEEKTKDEVHTVQDEVGKMRTEIAKQMKSIVTKLRKINKKLPKAEARRTLCKRRSRLRISLRCSYSNL